MRVNIAIDTVIHQLRVKQMIRESLTPDMRHSMMMQLLNLTYNLSQGYVPVATGYLKSTAERFINPNKEYGIGYSANYAGFVHESSTSFLWDSFTEALHELIAKYGDEFIPDFYIKFVPSTEGVSLTLLLERTGRELSWRGLI